MTLLRDINRFKHFKIKNYFKDGYQYLTIAKVNH